MKKPETYKVSPSGLTNKDKSSVSYANLAEAEQRKQVERIAAACPEFLGPLHSLRDYLSRKEKIQKRSGTVRSSWGSKL